MYLVLFHQIASQENHTEMESSKTLSYRAVPKNKTHTCLIPVIFKNYVHSIRNAYTFYKHTNVCKQMWGRFCANIYWFLYGLVHDFSCIRTDPYQVQNGRCVCMDMFPVRPSPYIPTDLCWDCTNETRLISSVKMSPCGSLKLAKEILLNHGVI